MSEFTPYQIKIEDVYSRQEVPRVGKILESKFVPRHFRVTAEFRPPRSGEWCLDLYGCPYQALCDFTGYQPRIILEEVKPKTIKVPVVNRLLPGKEAKEGEWVIYAPRLDSDYPMLDCRLFNTTLPSHGYRCEVEMVEMEEPEA